MNGLFTLLISINLGLLSLAISLHTTYHSALTKELPLEVAKVIDRKYLFWSSIAVSILAVAANLWFLIRTIGTAATANTNATPILPKILGNLLLLPGPPDYLALGITLGLTSVNVFLLILVVLLKSSWGITRNQPHSVANKIGHKANAKSLLLLIKLANNRFDAHDLKGWNDTLVVLSRVSISLLRKRKFKPEDQPDILIAQTLEQLERLDGANSRPEYVVSKIEYFQKLAEIAMQENYDQLSINLASQLINMITVTIHKQWQTSDRRRVTAASLSSLAQIAVTSLNNAKSTITHAILVGVRKAVYDTQRINASVFYDICLNFLPFSGLLWEEAIQRRDEQTATRVAGVVSELGRFSLEQGNLWLTAICIKSLQQFADAYLVLSIPDQHTYSIIILNALISVVEDTNVQENKLVNKVILDSCIYVVSCSPPSPYRETLLDELQMGEPTLTLSNVISDYASATKSKLSDT